MSAISLLDEVISELEQNDDLVRIKRLMLFTCHDFWVSDVNELQNLDLREMVQELLAVIPTLDNLRLALNNHVKKLSKPDPYLLAANVIIDTVGLLYTSRASDESESTTFLTSEDRRSPQSTEVLPPPSYAGRLIRQDLNQDLQVSTPTGHFGAIASSYDMASDEQGVYSDAQVQQYGQDSQITFPREEIQFPDKPSKPDYIIKPFDLRYQIASNINPLRAKVLIFSALYYKFDPRDRDWANICSHDLDDLLLELFQTCDTFEELETKLYETARQLEDPQENQQAAGSICGAMQSLY